MKYFIQPTEGIRVISNLAYRVSMPEYLNIETVTQYVFGWRVIDNNNDGGLYSLATLTNEEIPVHPTIKDNIGEGQPVYIGVSYVYTLEEDRLRVLDLLATQDRITLYQLIPGNWVELTEQEIIEQGLIGTNIELL